MCLQVCRQLGSIRQHTSPNNTYCEQTAQIELFTLVYEAQLYGTQCKNVKKLFFKVFNL